MLGMCWDLKRKWEQQLSHSHFPDKDQTPSPESNQTGSHSLFTFSDLKHSVQRFESNPLAGFNIVLPNARQILKLGS